MAFAKEVSTLRSYITRRDQIGYHQSPIIKKSFDAVRQLNKGSHVFENGEPVLHHLLDTAETALAWGMPDNVIAAALCHRENIESDVFKDSELSSIMPVLKAYNHIENFINPDIMNNLKPSQFVGNNFQNMLLNIKDFEPSGHSVNKQSVFWAHILRAADQLSTLKSGQISRWNHNQGFNHQTYSWMALSTAMFLRNINMELAAGEIFDIVYSILNPEEFKYYYDLLYGNEIHHMKMLQFKDDTSELLGSDLPDAFFKFASRNLNDQEISFDIYSRIKSTKSFAKKVKARGMEDFTDDIGFRIIIKSKIGCDSIDQYSQAIEARNKGEISPAELDEKREEYQKACEAVYLCRSIITDFADSQGWTEIDDRNRDYIVKPRENNYQALQRSFIVNTGSDPLRFEIQLRTGGMHEWAEWGGASHGHYQDLKYQKDDSMFSSNNPPQNIASDTLHKDAGSHYGRFLTLLKELKNGNSAFGFTYYFDKLGDIEKKQVINKIALEGPFRLDPFNGKPICLLDLAFARDHNIGLRAAQIFQYDFNKNREIECRLNKPADLNSPTAIRVITSNKITPSEERLLYLGTNARYTLQKFLLRSRDQDIKSVLESGESLYNSSLDRIKTMHLGLLRNIVDINNKRLKTVSFIPEKTIIKNLGVESFKDLLINIGSSNTIKPKISAFIDKNPLTLAYDSSNSLLFFAYNNSNYTNYILKAILNKTKEIPSLSISGGKNGTTLQLKLKDMNISEIEKSLKLESVLTSQSIIGLFFREETMEIGINKMNGLVISKISEHVINSGGEISHIKFPEIEANTGIKVMLKIKFPNNFSAGKTGRIKNSLASIPGINRVNFQD